MRPKATKHMSMKKHNWVEKSVDLSLQQAYYNVREEMKSFQECSPNGYPEGLDNKTTQKILLLINTLEESCVLAHEVDENIGRDQCGSSDLHEKHTKIRETAKLVQLKVSQLEDILESYCISADKEQIEEEGLCRSGLIE